MRALITGACGFVGAHLAQHLIQAGDQVLGTIRPGLPPPAAFKSVELDVTNAAATTDLVASYKPEAVYHLAGISFVPEAEENFKLALDVNVGGTYNVYRACQVAQLSAAVVLVSSAEVYGAVQSSELPLTESSALRPLNNYSLSKLMAEQVPLKFRNASGIRLIIARPFNHIGPGQNDRFAASSFARQLARIARGKAPPVIAVGNLTARRDFSDVRDIVRGYRLAAVGGQGTYNFSSGRAIQVRELLNSLVAASGVEVRIESDPARMRPVEVPIFYGSYERARRELGWDPGYPLEQSLRDVFDYWYQKE